MDGAGTRQDAEAALAGHLDSLAQAASAALAAEGCGDSVSVSITDEWFPTKAYGAFSLPAGRYRALRVVIGEGAGHNWWCVVFPPLCLGSVTEEGVEAAAEGVLTDGQVALITGQDGGYVLKFRLMEWWGELARSLGVRPG